MKKSIVLLFVVGVLCSFTHSEKLKPFNIVGKWMNTGEKDKDSGFIFDAEGYIYMYKKEEKIGGKNFSSGGAKGVMKYVYDKKSNPNKLDLVITITSPVKETKRVLMLVKVVDDNTISIAAEDAEDARPTGFTKANSITFKRVK